MDLLLYPPAGRSFHKVTTRKNLEGVPTGSAIRGRRVTLYIIHEARPGHLS